MGSLKENLDKLSEIEVKSINFIYKYNYIEIRSIKNEELAYELNIKLDDLESVLDRLIDNNIIIKNGDRFNVNSDIIKKLISMGILDINGIISHLSTNLYEANLSLNKLNEDLSSVRNELSEIKEYYKQLKKK